MPLIDTHAHLNFLAYDEDREQVIGRVKELGMKVIIPSSQLDTSKQAVDLAGKHNFLFAAIGQHPIHVFDEEFKPEAYQQLIDTGLVKAIGETGLDYFHIKDKTKPVAEVKAAQEKLFRQQIELALVNNLPLIIHGRFSEAEATAYEDIFAILQAMKVQQAVIHCFTGSLSNAQPFIQAGYYLGFTGIITFDKTGVLAAVIKNTPLEQILIETDAPYLSPVPYRGKRNEPVYVLEVAKKIAEIKQIPLDKVIAQTGSSAEKLFKL